MKTLLVDNGSLEPAATLALRKVATEFSIKMERRIQPVSLLHSHKVSKDELGGVAAEIVETYLRRELAAGESKFTIVPLFIGPSRAITGYLPELIETLRQEYPQIKVKIAPTLYQEGDQRFATMLADRVRDVLVTVKPDGDPIRVALVDHGSPLAEVTAVRNALADQLGPLLDDAVAQVVPCSMERRSGQEYDFNEPLLETLLAREDWREATVIVAQLFLVPGRHAGPSGDIAQLCARAEASSPNLTTMRTEVLATHHVLIETLEDRLRSA